MKLNCNYCLQKGMPIDYDFEVIPRTYNYWDGSGIIINNNDFIFNNYYNGEGVGRGRESGGGDGYGLGEGDLGIIDVCMIPKHIAGFSNGSSGIGFGHASICGGGRGSGIQHYSVRTPFTPIEMTLLSAHL